MLNVLVTGGGGFIGRYLVKKLLSKDNYKVSIIDRFYISKESMIPEYSKNSYKVSFYKEDIRKKNSILDILKCENVDACIHLAAKTSVSDSITNPDNTIEVNVKGTMNVLEACSSNNVKSFVFASSAAVYGEPKKLPLSESHELCPLSPYGASKVTGEKLVCMYALSKKIQNTISLRFFNIYGKGQNIEYAGVITKFAERLYNRLPPMIYGDGKNTRDFISVNDAVNAILLALKTHKMKAGVFNVGTGVPVSITDLAKKMIKIRNLDLEPIYCEAKEGDIKYSYADMTKSKRVLRFNATEKFESGLNQILKKFNL